MKPKLQPLRVNNVKPRTDMRIYREIERVIASGTEDFQAIAEQVADNLGLKKNYDSLSLIMRTLGEYNDRNDTAY